MSNIFYWVKKRLVFGCFRIEEIRDKDNEIGLKEGGGIKIKTTTGLPLRDARSFAFVFYLLPLNHFLKQMPLTLCYTMSR